METKKVIFFMISLFCLGLTRIQAQNTVKDIDGNVYKTITIGKQTWMAENLKTTKYNDGSAIPNVAATTERATLLAPGYNWYNNDEVTNKATYGALYNGYAVNTGKLCPKGWHVPSDDEWTTLTDTLGDNNADKLKETGITHWASPNADATNESGFTALPGGISYGGTFIGVGYRGFWWSSTDYWYREMVYDNRYVLREQCLKENLLSVRCLKN